jgi:ABC-type antimicrobial peptide transport system permease subunit
MRTALTAVEQVFRKYNPTVPFEYTFVDDDYARKFSDEQRVASLSGLFTILAILISCLGLFGLAAYRMEQRTKEIGIRKVLGAPVAHLWRILTKDFIVLVLLSCVIAVPLSIAFLHQWLRQYEYRTDLPWYTFIAACGGALGIALLTISYHAVKATRTNPIESLRLE